MKPCEIWIEQCNAARMIEDEFGTDKALRYLISEKFLDYLEAAERLPRLPGGTRRLRRRDQDDLRALATRRVPGDGTPERAFLIPTSNEDEEKNEFIEMERRNDFAARLPISCSWNVPESGCWRERRSAHARLLGGSPRS